MKKSILFFSLLFIGISCQSDDTTEPDLSDPLFESEYTPLEDLSELGSTYIYYGAKIGDRPFGAISGSNCLSNNTLRFYISNDIKFGTDSIVFKSFEQESKKGKCVTDFVRTMREVEFTEEGKLNVDISDYHTVIVKDITTELGYRIEIVKEVHFMGDIEIGLQGGYLRIEDKFTRYKGNDKVYQYFKKSNIVEVE